MSGPATASPGGSLRSAAVGDVLVEGLLRWQGGVVTVLEVLARARELGFLGPGPVEAHVAQAEAFVVAGADAGGAVLDLGSGGGVPGLVLAERWPERTFVLVEAQRKRTDFLLGAIEALGWAGRVEVRNGRAEEFGREAALRGGFGLVTARSFGTPAIAAECGAPFLAPGGVLVVAEPPEERAARWPADGLARLGLEDRGVVRAGAASVRVLQLAGVIDERYPRRTGIPAKRPVF